MTYLSKQTKQYAPKCNQTFTFQLSKPVSPGAFLAEHFKIVLELLELDNKVRGV